MTHSRTLPMMVSFFIIVFLLTGCNLDGSGLLYDAAHSQEASTHKNESLLLFNGTKAFVQAAEGVLVYTKDPSSSQVIHGDMLTITGVNGKYSTGSMGISSAEFSLFEENPAGNFETKYTVPAATGIVQNASPIPTDYSSFVIDRYGNYIYKTSDWYVNGTQLTGETSSTAVFVLGSHYNQYATYTKTGDNFSVKVNNGVDIITPTFTSEPTAYYVDGTSPKYLLTSDGHLWSISGTTTASALFFKKGGNIYLTSNRKVWLIDEANSNKLIDKTDDFPGLSSATNIVGVGVNGTSVVFITEKNGAYFY